MNEPPRVQTPCETVIRRLMEGDLQGWEGLPDGCRHEDMAAVLQGGEEAGNGRLSGTPLQFRTYESTHQSRPIEAWFGAGGTVVLVTFRNPELKEAPSTLLERLGPPEERLDAGIGPEADAHQWVYASRGLTLFVRESADAVARIAAYPPVSTSYYQRYLGARDQREHLPRPDWL